MPAETGYRAYLRDLPDDWPTAAISEVARVVGGGTPSRDVSRFWSGSIPWVTPGEISGETSMYLSDTRDHISEAGLAGSGATLLPAGSLMITTRATLGARAINFAPMTTNQGFKSLVFQDPSDASFFFWLTDKLRPELKRRASGTTFLEVAGGEVGRIHVPMPPKVERDQIARVLDNIETNIRQTEAIIEKLKQVKQGLLHDLLTRGIDANGELRLPQSEAPHLYKDSPLGWIPRGWEVGPVACWLEGRPKNGYSPQPAGRWTGIQMLGLGCLTADGFEPRQLKDAPLGDPLVPKAFLVAGDLLISRANTRELVGLVGTYRDVGTSCCYPDLMMRLTPNIKASAAFLELLLRSPPCRRQIQASASGTSGSMVKISSAIVMGLSVAMPAPAEQGRMLDCLGASARRLTAEVELVEHLLALKCGLMDDLLTGRVRVTPLLQSNGQSPIEGNTNYAAVALS